MNKLALLLIITTMSSSVHAKWVKILSEGTGGTYITYTFYVDPASIQSLPDNTVEATSLVDQTIGFRTRIINGKYSSYYSRIEKNIYDCSTKKEYKVSEEQYAGHMGNGELLDKINYENFNQLVRATGKSIWVSGEESETKFVCDTAAKQLLNMQLSIYRDSFKNAVSASDWMNFIQTYHEFDPDKLLPKAKINWKQANTREIILAAKRQKKLLFWRKHIKVGDETFCGPIINIRKPMIKIAVRVLLPGYPSEVWLNESKVYPIWMANCRNTNGQLSAIMN